MRPATTTLTLLLLTSAALFAPRSSLAAPAPDGTAAKRNLEALRMKMPDLLKTWNKNYLGAARAVVRRVRLIGDGQAKLTIGVYEGKTSADSSPPNHLLTIYLTYHNGLWTTTRSQWSSSLHGNQSEKAAHFLMDAIDELAEK